MRTPIRIVLACSVIASVSGCRGQPPAPEAQPDIEVPEPAPKPATADETGGLADAIEAPTGETEAGASEPIAEPAAAELAAELAAEPTADLADWSGDAPALITWSETGISVTDGKRERSLVEAPIETARYDPARRVIWYHEGKQLRALDLLRPPGKPIVVLDKVPPDTTVYLADGGVWLGEQRVPEYLDLRWAAGLKLELALTFDEVMNEALADALRGATIVDRSWLEALAKRELRTLPKPAKTEHLTGAPLEHCTTEDEPACGVGVAWPKSTWKLYVTAFDCGDYCHWSCGLWDSKTGHTADPDTLPTPTWDPEQAVYAGTCGPFYTDASGSAMVVGDQLCRGKRCSPLPGSGSYALGFLDPGPTIEAHP